jgi:hypothetical protein
MNLHIALTILFLFQAAQPDPLLDNEFVRVFRGSAPCASAGSTCGDRVVVALGSISLNGHAMARGDIKVFTAGQRYTPPDSRDYLEVSIKPTHPKVAAPSAQTPPTPDNKVLYDCKDFAVFAERMQPGEMSSVHSHNQRVAIFLNKTQVEQWEGAALPPNGKGNFRDLVPDTVMWRPAVVHASKDVGKLPISNLLIEFKP